MKSIFVLVSVCLLAACNWVKTEPGADTVALVKAAHVTSCKKLGNTVSAVTDKLAGIKRKEKKVADELIRLAKNTAYDMGGDTLLALSEADGGQQKFAVYRCAK